MDAKELSIKYSGHLRWGWGLNIWKIEAKKNVVWPTDEDLVQMYELFADARRADHRMQIAEKSPRKLRIAIPLNTKKTTLKALIAVIASQIP